MIYQLRWSTEPGLRGIFCSQFGTVPVPAGAEPDNERGIAVEFGSDAERDKFLRQLEEQFAAQRFSNSAAAFESVKTFVLTQAGRK